MDQLSITRDKARAYLKKVQRPDGFFPYKASGDPSTEATAWAAIALCKNAEPALPALTDALRALANSQGTKGGWATRQDTGRPDWTSGPATLALRVAMPRLKPALASEQRLEMSSRRGLDYLLESRTDFYGPTARLLLFLTKGRAGLDYSRGWPWDPECFHWIEPTAYCLMAAKIPNQPKKGALGEMIELAERFILDHHCIDGGWNHGNNITLGAYLPSYRLTTAEALLALQNRRDDKKVDQAVHYLSKQSQSDSSAHALAMSILALAAYQKSHATNFDRELKQLMARQKDDGSFGHDSSVLVTALALLALETALDTDDQLLVMK